MSPKKNEKKADSWWTSLLGLLTAVATLVTALGGVYIAFRPVAPSGGKPTSQDEVFRIVVLRFSGELESLGTATSEPIADVIRIQHFSKGWMIWTRTDDQLYLLEMEPRQWRRATAPPIDEKEAEAFLRGSSDSRKKNFASWKGGFFRLWFGRHLMDTMGWPEHSEYQLTVAVMQRFKKGILMREVPFYEPTFKVYKGGPGEPRWVLMLRGEQEGDWGLFRIG